MPYINKNYRTKRGAANTVIAGSSMGCLISLYGLLEYPKTFGAAGLFSGAYWIAPEVETEVARLTPKLKARVFLYAGDNESKSLMPQTQRIAATLRANRKNSVREMYQPGGRHEEVFWQQPFREFMLWQGKQ